MSRASLTATGTPVEPQAFPDDVLFFASVPCAAHSHRKRDDLEPFDEVENRKCCLHLDEPVHAYLPIHIRLIRAHFWYGTVIAHDVQMRRGQKAL